MATLFHVHPENPQPRLIEQIRDELRSGAVMLYPTDTVYAIGCDLTVKSAVEQVRRIKRLDNNKPLTFLCSSLSNVAHYAWVQDGAYRLMRRLVPGPYTFLLPATKLVPRLVMEPKRKTTGIRVPDHAICRALVDALGNPVISTSAHTLSEDGRTKDGHCSRFELFDHLEKLVDVIVDSDTEPGFEVSTIVDLTQDEPTVVRQGLGWEAIAEWILVS
ncbi:L-threonylcarbamoyladenylate synthase [Trichothermofontia sp.]